MSKKLLREFIREMLREDALGFIQQVGNLVDRVGADDFSADRRGEHGPPRKEATKEVRRAIKQIFRDEADHKWLSTLNTVHWAVDPDALMQLKGRNRDELSTIMTLPSDPLASFSPARYPFGLWVRGRITLAADDMDDIWSGHYGKYMTHPVFPKDGPTPEQLQRQRSSGVNKLPGEVPLPNKWNRMAKNIGRKREEWGEEKLLDLVLDEFPYILDRQTWQTTSTSNRPNEALVDNWKPVGIVVPDEFAGYVTDDLAIGSVAATKEAATEFGVPVFNSKKEEVWTP
jgi:hypothetical protein